MPRSPWFELHLDIAGGRVPLSAGFALRSTSGAPRQVASAGHKVQHD